MEATVNSRTCSATQDMLDPTPINDIFNNISPALLAHFRTREQTRFGGPLYVYQRTGFGLPSTGAAKINYSFIAARQLETLLADLILTDGNHKLPIAEAAKLLDIAAETRLGISQCRQIAEKIELDWRTRSGFYNNWCLAGYFAIYCWFNLGGIAGVSFVQRRAKHPTRFARRTSRGRSLERSRRFPRVPRYAGRR